MKVHPKRFRWIVKRLIWVLAAFVLFLIVLGAIQYKRKSFVNNLKIKIIEDKEGNRFVNAEDVKSILFNNFGHYVEGQTVEKINIEATEAALESDLFIKEADVYVDALNNVNITVVQRVPILRVLDMSGESYYLDDSGRRVPFSTKYTSRTIVATGEIGAFTEGYLEIRENRLNQLYKLTKNILENPFLTLQIEQIHLNKEGEVILVPKLGNHKILFGKPDLNVKDKLFRLRTFYEKGLAYEGWEKFKTINLTYDNQVVAKRRVED